MSLETKVNLEKQVVFPSPDFAPSPVVVSASRRTELVGLRPAWLVNTLKRFPKEIHSVVLWTKDPTNIYEHPQLREELSKHNLLVHFTLTGLGGTRLEPTVPKPMVLLDRLPRLLESLKDTRRLRWRFDPIVTLEKEDGTQWTSAIYFEGLATEMAKFGIDNCYFSFCEIYPKFRKRHLEKAGIKIVKPPIEEQFNIVDKMRVVAERFGIILYSCAQPQLEQIPGITAAKCIDAELLTQLHPQGLSADQRRDDIQQKFRPACYCTKSQDIGAYLPCGHGCVYCYAEPAVPKLEELLQKPLPWDTRS